MNSGPNWDLYRAFEAVLRLGSLSAAARMLGLTQPTVARQIDSLETALRLQLFVRSQRGLVPTAAAVRLQPYAETLCRTTAALVRHASSASAIGGTVRITAGETVANQYLPAVLAGLRYAHPSLHLELSVADAIEDLTQRKADIAVRMVEPTQKTLVNDKVNTVEYGLYAHVSYLDRRGIPSALGDLASYDIIGFDTETPTIRAAAEHHAWLRREHFALRTDSWTAQLAAIRCGLGIGYCQVWVARETPGLIRILEEEYSLHYPMWVVMHRSLLPNAACRTVYDALVISLRDMR
jgi:DNA-binding transcriptional LysR family regulator